MLVKFDTITQTQTVSFNGQTESIPITCGVATCPKCGATLASQQGVLGETLHKIMIGQNHDNTFYCIGCGEKLQVGAMIDLEAHIEVVGDENGGDK